MSHFRKNFVCQTINDVVTKYFPIKYASFHDNYMCKSNVRETLAINCDLMRLHTLLLPHDINLTKIHTFDIIIGGIYISRIPFSLMCKLSKIRQINNEIYIPIDKNLLGEFDIYLILLDFHRVEINLISESTFYYKLITNNITFPIDKRKDIKNSNANQYKINQFQIFNIQNESNLIYPELISDGIFIEINSLIINFELILDGCLHTRLNNNLIEFYGNIVHKKNLWTRKCSLTLEFILNKILPLELIHHIENFVNYDDYDNTEYLYYFPFDLTNTHTNNINDINSQCMIHFSYIHNVDIKLKTINNIYHGKIYVKNKNILQYARGIAELIFSS